MTQTEQEIHDRIQRWVDAVRAGDLDAVVADHAADIVMFDVPPPEQGVRGLDAYRATWPPFFEWVCPGSFELRGAWIVTHEHHSFADKS